MGEKEDKEIYSCGVFNENILVNILQEIKNPLRIFYVIKHIDFNDTLYIISNLWLSNIFYLCKIRIAGWKYYINLRLHFYVGASISGWEISNRG